MTKANRARFWFWLSGVIAGASWIVSIYLTWTTPQQPDPATGRVHRESLKGSTRYFTDREQQLYVTSSLVGVVSTLVFVKFKRDVDEEERIEREALEQGNTLGLRS